MGARTYPSQCASTTEMLLLLCLEDCLEARSGEAVALRAKGRRKSEESILTGWLIDYLIGVKLYL